MLSNPGVVDREGSSMRLRRGTATTRLSASTFVPEDRDLPFRLTPFALLTLVILDRSHCSKIDRLVQVKTAFALLAFTMLCLGAYTAAHRKVRSDDGRAVLAQHADADAWDVYDLLVGAILVAVLAERVKTTTLEDFCWFAATKMRERPEDWTSFQHRAVLILSYALAITHCWVLYATAVLLSASDGIDIYLNSFALYFLFELDEMLFGLVRLSEDAFRDTCTAVLQQLAEHGEPSSPSVRARCSKKALTDGIWLILFLLAELCFVVARVTGKVMFA